MLYWQQCSAPSVACARGQVSTSNLERVRKVKTRHQRLLARVTTVREELQRFLEDDDDMAKMCLTRKKEIERKVSVGTQTSPQPSNQLPCHQPYAPGSPRPAC